ncbi:hypothetical protein F4821DRAFT_278199 [Hypoxylon rubiginosum]|uniref:Uncharacterized protein n=1 Tax=Hypoxylon rubiginosum TaxID=110542 RepID=A0ACC0D314_9PEZI|nr:hypothetical protein F4821DRAFT_278199 [Hypoxylon rubiginosum]
MRCQLLASIALLALSSYTSACSTRDDCSGDQVCAQIYEFYSSYAVYECMEPSSACCAGSCVTCGQNVASASCDIYGNPGDFDAACS